jgi:hypothetical protein
VTKSIFIPAKKKKRRIKTFRDFFSFQDQIMNEQIIESLSQSSTSLQSDGSIISQRTSIDILYDSTNVRKRHGIIQKIGTGFQSIFRRFSKKHKTLSQLELQILLTITHFNREEILSW